MDNDLSAEECIDACLGYGTYEPWGPYGWANYNPGTNEACTCSTDCAGGYDTSASVSDDATVWALEPVRGPFQKEFCRIIRTVRTSSPPIP